MSNHRAIAAVTATLKRTLQDVLNEQSGVASATVTVTRPQSAASDAAPGLNLYLYQVLPNLAFRNADLPTRRAQGEVVQRPQLALNLHYLFSFYGNETNLEPQLLLGSVMRALHAAPVLTPEQVEQTVNDPQFAPVQDSDLASSVESVKLSLAALSLEDLSKLWSVFFQVPYALSVVYEASVVLIEQVLPTRVVLPVKEARVHSVLLQTPIIEEVLVRSTPADSFRSRAPVLAGSRLLLRGSALQGSDTRLRFGALTVAPVSLSPNELQVDVPSALLAGAQQLKVEHSVPLGEPAQPHRVITSAPVSFELLPHVTRVVALDSAEVELEISPRVARAQRVALSLRSEPGAAGAPRSFTIEAPARPVGGPPDTDRLTFSLAGVTAGRYLMRVKVDTSESPVDFEPALGPMLTVPV